MDCSAQFDAIFFQLSDGLDVLNSDAFHVLSSSGVDVAVGVLFGSERIMRPFFLYIKYVESMMDLKKIPPPIPNLKGI